MLIPIHPNHDLSSGYGLREFLTSELFRRKSNNPNYSLRAFARTLGMSPAFISMYLSGQREISKKRAHQVCERLKEINAFPSSNQQMIG